MSFEGSRHTARHSPPYILSRGFEMRRTISSTHALPVPPAAPSTTNVGVCVNACGCFVAAQGGEIGRGRGAFDGRRSLGVPLIQRGRAPHPAPTFPHYYAGLYKCNLDTKSGTRTMPGRMTVEGGLQVRIIDPSPARAIRGITPFLALCVWPAQAALNPHHGLVAGCFLNLEHVN